MRKAITCIMTSISLAMLFMIFVPSASASDSVMTSWIIAGSETTYMSCKTLNGKVTQCDWGQVMYVQGDWNGQMTYDCHSASVGDQQMTLQCKGTFKGNILGMSGTASTRFSERIHWDWTQIDLTSFIDVENLGQGTGGLEGIHGTQDHFTLDWNTGTWTSYWWIHFK